MVSRGKPAPDLFLHAAKTMGFGPESCVVVEDSVPGVQAAVAARMRVLGYCAQSSEEALTAVGAFLMILTPAALPINPSNLEIELAGDPALAWRHWWLGNACAYLTLAGPVAALTVLRQRLKRLLFTPGSERRKFIGLVLSLLVATLFAFPVVNVSWINLPPDVELAKRLIPVPFAMAMAGRFRANGAAVATLIFAILAIVSVAGPAAEANWRFEMVARGKPNG